MTSHSTARLDAPDGSPTREPRRLRLSGSTRSRRKLLVVPPGHAAAEQALALAADPTNRLSTAEILAGRP